MQKPGYIREQRFRGPALVLTLLSVVFGIDIHAGDLQVHKNGNLKVLYENQLQSAARNVSDLFPDIRGNIEAIFGWRLRSVPVIILIQKREHFLRMTDNPATVAFAVPEKNLIAIDYSRMTKSPFSLDITLRHEICHILLHQHINGHRLPRWFDEGLCQWVSGGIDEMFFKSRRPLLQRAALSKRLIRLHDLQYRFPRDEESRQLAYEQSKNLISWLVNQYGKERMIAILDQMKNGDTAEDAFLRVLDESLARIEIKWQHSLRQNLTWFSYLSYHLYEILFAGLAVLSVYGFVKMRMKKLRYKDWEADDDGSGDSASV